MHLVSILGPSDFLNPICILLLEPVVPSDGNKKQQVDKVSLSVAIMQSRLIDARLAVRVSRVAERS